MDNNERQQLLDRLSRYFDGNAADPCLDEYDIVDAFDYAGDMDMLTLQEQISDYGNRRYPDFEPLLIRRALMLLDKGEREMADALARRVNPHNPLAAIYKITIRLDMGTPHNLLLDSLEKMVDAHDKFTDEEIIRICSLAMEMDGGFEWLQNHVKALKSKNDYPSTLYYEMAHSARESGHIPEAVEYCEELTMMEPFEVDFWEMLAELYIILEDYEKATSAVEYALAINPESKRSRIFASLLKVLGHGGDPEQILAGIDDLIFDPDLKEIPLKMTVATLANIERMDLAVEYIIRFVKLNPANPAGIDLLVQHAPTHQFTATALETYWSATDNHNEADWSAWARQCMESGMYESALAIFNTFLSHSQLQEPLYYLQTLYFTNHPDRVVQFMQSMKRPDPHSLAVYSTGEHSGRLEWPLIILISVMSYVRINRPDKALSIIESELPKGAAFMVPRALLNNVATFGYMSMLVYLREFIRMGMSPDDYDPLLLPSSGLVNLYRNKGGDTAQ